MRFSDGNSSIMNSSRYRLRFCAEPSKSIRSVSRLTIIVKISRIRGRSRILSEGGTTRYRSEQQPIPVALLRGALEVHPLGEPIDDHREDQPNQRPQPDLVGRRHDQVQRDRVDVIDEFVYREVAG